MININNTIWENVQAEDVKAQLEKTDTAENFFFEFKEDEESPAKLMKEICAFANTFGGYIFIGVTDKKVIKGCCTWNENRVHTTVHDSISPIPLFDVKSFIIDGVSVLVIRVEEGSKPPYIINDGRIYERVSSGSFPIKDSSKLSVLFSKRKDYYERIKQTIEFPPFDLSRRWFPENLCACIDVGGFITIRGDLPFSLDLYNCSLYDKIASITEEYQIDRSISIVGQRILVTLAKRTASTQGDKQPVALCGGLQNVLEVLRDGSFRYRIVLALDNGNKSSITCIDYLSRVYQDIYKSLVGEEFYKVFIQAEKYDQLQVFRQFVPYYHLNDTNEQAAIAAHSKLETDHIEKYGENHIAIGNRFPATGYLHLDKSSFDKYEVEWNTDQIIQELFGTVYSNLGFIDTPQW